MSAEWTPYVRALGQFALTWNDLHERLGVIFWSITESEMALSIWQSSNQDRAKRKMLEAIVPDISLAWRRDFPKLIPDLKWLLHEVTSFEESRNDAVHAPLWNFPDAPNSPVPAGVRAADFLGNKRAKNLASKEILQEYRWCRDTAFTLRDFAMELELALDFPKRPWPDKPKLPNRGQKKAHQPRQARTKSRALQPPPSPA